MKEIEIIGYIGSDAEQVTNVQNPYTRFNVAVSERHGDKEETTWFTVFLSGNSDRLVPYLLKGSKVFVRGRLSASIYTNQQGESRLSLSVNASPYNLHIVEFRKNETAQPDTTPPTSYGQQGAMFPQQPTGFMSRSSDAPTPWD